MNSSDLKDAFVQFINEKKEYEVVKEQETTKREAIHADLQKYLTKVNQTKILVNHLSSKYITRKETLEKVFEKLDQALEQNKDSVAIQIVNSLEGIVKENPLKEIEQIGKAFSTGGTIEI